MPKGMRSDLSKHNKLSSTLAVLIGLACSPVQAEMLVMAEEDLMLLYEDEEMVSIATGTQKPIHLAPSVASVITAKEIKASGARTLDEALATVAGLHVSKDKYRNGSIYSIRGIHTDWNSQVLLLVNGLPFNEFLTGSRPPLFRLAVDNIARIEVVRGPGSAVFGADAFAGVINVIIKQGDDIDGSVVGARTGSFDTQEIWLQHGADFNGWNVGLSLEYSSSDGDDGRIVNSDLQTGFDALFGTNASLAPGPLASRYRLLNTSITAKRNQWNIWFNSWNLNDAGIGPGVAQALDPVGSQNGDHYSLVLDYNDDQLLTDWQMDSRLSYRLYDQQSVYQLLPPGAEVPIGADGNLLTAPGCGSPTNHAVFGPVCLVSFPDGLWGNPGGEMTETRFEVAGIYQGWQDHQLRLALGVDRDELVAKETKNFGPGVIDGTVSPVNGTLSDVTGTADIFSPDVSRTLHYLSLQDELRLARDWELTAGIRYDDYSDFGSTTNPRLALVWAMDYNLTSKLLYGRAFRAPSVTELYFQNNPVTIGNVNLEPEELDMLELVFDYRPSFDVQTILNIFAYQADKLIELDSSFVAQNNRKQEGHGLEFEATWQAHNDVQLKGNFALQYSEDADSGVVIQNAPRRQLFVATNWRATQAWSVYGQANWVADRARATGDARSAIDDYTTVDISLRNQQQNTPWAFAASIKNAFDEDVREPSDGTIPDDYPLEGRAIYLEASYHLGH